MSKFQSAETYQAKSSEWEFLPFRFERLNGRVLVTNLVGEHLFLNCDEFEQMAEKRLPADSPLVRKLRAKLDRLQDVPTPQAHLTSILRAP